MASSEVTTTSSFGEQQFYDLLNYAGNHELKLLTGSVILTNPDTAFSAASLLRTINNSQGDGEPAWKFKSTMLRQYCTHSFMPIDLVTETETAGQRGKPVPGYQAQPTDLEAKLGCLGSLLEWSLDHPNTSVQNAFGLTRSSTQVHSPEMRHRIYKTLLTTGEGITMLDISRLLEGPSYGGEQGTSIQLRRMQELGLLSIKSVIGENPEVVINDTRWSSSHRFEDAQPQLRAVISACKQIGQGQTTTVNDIVAEALKIDSGIDGAALRSRIMASINRPGTGYSWLERVDDRSPQLTYVSFAPEAKGPITDLHERLETVEAGDYRKSKAVGKILGDSDAFSVLVAKAKRFSPRTYPRTAGKLLEAELASIVTTTVGMTAKEVREALIAEHNRDISMSTVVAALRKMADNGKIAREERVTAQHSTKVDVLFKALDTSNRDIK